MFTTLANAIPILFTGKLLSSLHPVNDYLDAFGLFPILSNSEHKHSSLVCRSYSLSTTVLTITGNGDHPNDFNESFVTVYGW